MYELVNQKLLIIPCHLGKIFRHDDIKRLLEIKDFSKSSRRRDSVGSDDSDLSTQSMPQYSSYR